MASRQPVRAANRNYRKLWEERAAGRGQLIRQRPAQRTSARALAVRADAIKAWKQIALALSNSKDPADLLLAEEAVRYLAQAMQGGQEAVRASDNKTKRLRPDRPGDDRSAPKTEQDRSR